MDKQAKRWMVGLGAGAGTFLALDGVWITAVAKKVYDNAMPHLMASSPRPAPAAVFYAGYLAGLVQIAARPGESRSTLQRLRDGALLGALAYGTWGFTGASVLKGFPVKVALADCAWGAALSGVTAVAAGAAMDAVAPR